MQTDLYGQSFYGCFVNGDHGSIDGSLSYNEYELVHTDIVDPFLKQDSSLVTFYRKYKRFAGRESFDKVYSEFLQCGLKGTPFIYDKLEYIGKQQIYYTVVHIHGKRAAGKLGEYKKWYKITFAKKGKYECKVQDYSAPTEEQFKELDYRCDIEAISKEANEFIMELYRIHPDEESIHSGKKGGKSKSYGLGTLQNNTAVNSFRVWHCTPNFYLCVEFCDATPLPLGIFDMGYHPSVFDYYSDQNLSPPPNNNWGGREPITVIISHFHRDHVNGLNMMVAAQGGGGPNTYHHLFHNIDLHMPDTLQPASYAALVTAVRAAGGNVTIYDDQQPFSAPGPHFGIGLGEFKHPRNGARCNHPHLHGLYVCCHTAGGRTAMLAGDTVYRGMPRPGIGMQAMPGMDDLGGPYDVLVASHHGGDYSVAEAGSNFLQGITKQQYIPVPIAATPTNIPVVIYSANGDGLSGAHPHSVRMREYTAQGWRGWTITNAAHSASLRLPIYVQRNANGVDVS